MPISIGCPACGKKYALADHLLGKQVKCKACGNVFLVQPKAAAPTAKAKSSAIQPEARPGSAKKSPDAGKPPRRRPADDEDDDDRPKRRRRKSAERERSNVLLWVGGLVVFVAGAVGVTLWLRRDSGVKNVPVVAGVRPNANQLELNPPEAGGQEGPGVKAIMRGASDGEVSSSTTNASNVEFGPMRLLQPGVQFQEATLQPQSVPMKVWLYLPEKAASDKLPLVVVPPTGSNLLFGMALANRDRPEHLPYVKAGFATASFEIDGHVSNRKDEAAFIRGAKLFKEARAGLKNASAALDFLLAKAPNIDATRIYIAGHSSAGSLALLAAAHEPRIKACIAHAPATDVVSSVGPGLPTMERFVPGITEFIRFSSPMTHLDKLTCPILLFHAQDDSVVPIQQTLAFADALKKHNSQVTLITAATGNHHQSMINEGLPKGISWLKMLR